MDISILENTSDVISRKAALDATTETVFVEYEDGDPRKEESIILQTKAAIRDRIKALPPVQPKHGKWIPVTNGRGGHECDQCHNYAPSYASGREWLSDFCPNCGADMRCSENPNS